MGSVSVLDVRAVVDQGGDVRRARAGGDDPDLRSIGVVLLERDERHAEQPGPARYAGWALAPGVTNGPRRRGTGGCGNRTVGHDRSSKISFVALVCNECTRV